jgi:hypothetical protein
MNYERYSSTTLRVVIVLVQPQLKVLYMLAMHPGLEDGERASGLSSSNDDVLGHVTSTNRVDE